MNKSIAFIFAVSTLFLAGCCTTPHATMWEYKTIQTWPGNDAEVNKMVLSGWKVVGFSAAEDANKTPAVYYLLKKQKN